MITLGPESSTGIYSSPLIGQDSQWEAENPNFLVIWPTVKCEGSKWGRIWPQIHLACQIFPSPLIGRNSQWEAENPNFKTKYRSETFITSFVKCFHQQNVVHIFISWNTHFTVFNLKMFYCGLGLVAVSSDKLTTRWKLGFSASHWLFCPLRGLRDVSHVWDNAHRISGQILTHFDPHTCL